MRNSSTFVAPWRFASFLLSGPSTFGRCACGGAVQPNAWYTRRCFGVEGSQSSPRKTCEISMR